MNKISFCLPKIIFSNNSSDVLIKKIGKKKCIIFTSKYWTKSKLFKILNSNINFIKVINNIKPNPEIKNIFKTSLELKNVDIILCIGGGSVIDFTKAVLAFNAIEKNQEKFKEILFLGKKFNQVTTPKIIAVPTSSGTGSEVNSWGTIWHKGNKYSVSGRKLIPSEVIFDANLSKTMPTSLTISSGLDALSHAIEAILNINHNPIIDQIAMQAIEKIRKYLPLTLQRKNNTRYRRQMQQAAFLAGIAMSKTKTAICHSISYPLTSLYDLPHGIACSLTLPNICQLNMKQYPERTMIISRAMGCSNKNLERSLIDFFKSLKYKNYLKPIKKKDIDDSINFINPARSKNSLVEISNNHAVKIVKSSIKKFITS